VLEDREIMRRCQSGQTHLVDTLIDRHKTGLYTLCRRLTRNTAEADDLFQDTWVKVMKNINLFSLDRKFTTWLYAICVNLYRDQYRRRKRWWRRVKQYASVAHMEDEIARLPARDPGPDKRVVQRELIEIVQRSLAQLDDMFRLPLLLHYYHGLSMVEIGGILDIPPGTVKSRLAAGRTKLRAAMKDTGYGRP
jgi:RNA polymerase sigma-70 factor (ECF subfamily)